MDVDKLKAMRETVIGAIEVIKINTPWMKTTIASLDNMIADLAQEVLDKEKEANELSIWSDQEEKRIQSIDTELCDEDDEDLNELVELL